MPLAEVADTEDRLRIAREAIEFVATVFAARGKRLKLETTETALQPVFTDREKKMIPTIFEEKFLEGLAKGKAEGEASGGYGTKNTIQESSKNNRPSDSGDRRRRGPRFFGCSRGDLRFSRRVLSIHAIKRCWPVFQRVAAISYFLFPISLMLRTPLFDWHVAHRARMVDFGGWEMPIQYSSVIQEHEATRNAVGITDISHMGRLIFEGPGACDFLDSVLSRNVASIKTGQIRYSLLTNDQGGIVDDLLVGLLTKENGSPYYLLVVNASNRKKDIATFRKFLATASGVTMTDLTSDWAMIAVQGPKSLELLQPFLYANLSTIKYYNGIETTFHSGNRWVLITRTGYTGEDGFELCVDAYLAEQVAQELFKAGESLGGKPTGLGARDTLRLEAAMPLYGHEMNDQINPFEAGISGVLHLDGPDFPGRDALRRIKDEPLRKARIGLEMSEKRPAREGSEIFVDDHQVGWVTSGTLGPTLQKPIAMGYVPPEFSQPGQTLSVDIRGKKSPATVVAMPFYKRT